MASVIKMETRFVQNDRRVIDERQVVLQHICLQLASLGHKCQLTDDHNYLSVAKNLLKNYSEHRKLLAEYRCPADQLIEDFVNDYLSKNGIDKNIRLPGESFTLNEPGLARELSLPLFENEYKSQKQLIPQRRILRLQKQP